MPPEAGEVELGEYAQRCIAKRRLAPRTRELYEDLFKLYIRPHLAHLMLGAVKPQTIRTWRKRLLDDGTKEPQAVKAYCLLCAILNTRDEGRRDHPGEPVSHQGIRPVPHA